MKQGTVKKINLKRKLSVMAVMLSMTMLATGCRPSEVLEDVVYTEDGELDESQLAEVWTEDGKQEEYHGAKKEEESERIDDNENSAGESDPDGDSDVTAKDAKYSDFGRKDLASEDAPSDGETTGSSGGGVEGDDTGVGSGGGDSGSKVVSDGTGIGGAGNTGDDTKPSDSGDENKDLDTPQDEEDNPGVSVYPTKENVPKKTVTDANGVEQIIPEDVYTVTACGPAATIVEMVGGEDRLLASSESFLEGDMSKTLFSDLPEIHEWWSGNGESAISDDDFEKLLMESPDVCFEIDGQGTFTSEQIQQMQEVGIGYLVLPAMTSTDNLKDAVTIVANALETNETNGKSAKKIAQSYRDWVDDSIDEVKDASRNTVMYSNYFVAWEDDIQFTISDGGSGLLSGVTQFPAQTGWEPQRGWGVAVSYSPYSDVIIGSLMETAGVANVGIKMGTYVWGKSLKLSDTGSGEYLLVFPRDGIFQNLTYDRTTFDADKYCGMEGGARTGDMSCGIVNAVNVGFPSDPRLGGEGFPAIIVANETVKSKIENAYLWKYQTKDEFMSWTTINYSFIYGPYDIYVSPVGIDAWADGCVESPLESYWVANKISGTISNSLLTSRIRAFYQNFFGVSLSDSQIAEIIGE